MNKVELVEGIWICLGLTRYATGNSVQEAYNRLRLVAYDNDFIPPEMEDCLFYKADKSWSSC